MGTKKDSQTIDTLQKMRFNLECFKKERKSMDQLGIDTVRTKCLGIIALKSLLLQQSFFYLMLRTFKDPIRTGLGAKNEDIKIDCKMR